MGIASDGLVSYEDYERFVFRIIVKSSHDPNCHYRRWLTHPVHA